MQVLSNSQILEISMFKKKYKEIAMNWRKTFSFIVFLPNTGVYTIFSQNV